MEAKKVQNSSKEWIVNDNSIERNTIIHNIYIPLYIFSAYEMRDTKKLHHALVKNEWKNTLCFSSESYLKL